MGNVNLLVPSILMFVVLGVGFFLVLSVSRWGKRKGGDSALTELRGFSPGDLDSLKAQGLLSEDEAKRIQVIVAERTVEAMQRRDAETGSPPDLNTLLGEAERYRLQSLKGAEDIEAEMKTATKIASDPPAREGT